MPSPPYSIVTNPLYYSSSPPFFTQWLHTSHSPPCNCRVGRGLHPTARWATIEALCVPCVPKCVEGQTQHAKLDWSRSNHPGTMRQPKCFEHSDAYLRQRHGNCSNSQRPVKSNTTVFLNISLCVNKQPLLNCHRVDATPAYNLPRVQHPEADQAEAAAVRELRMMW